MQAQNLKIVIIDYKMGNLNSVKNALGFLGYRAEISDRREDVISADALVLPGVGAFGVAMRNLQLQGLIEPLGRKVQEEKTPFLGICLGMQLIAERSEEKGMHEGLGWIPGHVRRIKEDASIRVPHIGWNNTGILTKTPLFENIEDNPEFYYVHSYHFDCDAEFVAACCLYGSPLVAAVQRGNIHAVQFHPEKSQHNGLRVLRNFMNLVSAN
ncbi:MAG: imidazole glycerol phosphate synthase subunit HisH [Chloroflexota bacterium]